MTDLFGLEQQTPRTNDRPEAAALHEVLKALHAHPAVAWAERMNSGAVRVGGRFIRFGWPGCPDLLGQLKDGRLLGVEVKVAVELPGRNNCGRWLELAGTPERFTASRP